MKILKNNQHVKNFLGGNLTCYHTKYTLCILPQERVYFLVPPVRHVELFDADFEKPNKHPALTS